MSWYYAQNGKQLGPVSESEFQAAIGSGAITGETLVWREGLPEWKKYKDAGAAVATAGPVSSGTFGSAACVECGQMFPQTEMVQFGTNWVCGGCKPQYVQKLKEGMTIGGAMDYAGFWVRVGAKIVDLIIMQVFSMLLGVIFGAAGFGSGSGYDRTHLVATVLLVILQMTFTLGYGTFFVGKYGATPGKMACKLKVVREDGSPVGFGLAFGRLWAEMVSAIILYIGYMMAGWDPEKRALHDRICSTRVIHVR